MDINDILTKIKDCASQGKDITLSADETKMLAKQVGDLRFVPVFEMDELDKIMEHVSKGKSKSEDA